MVVLRTSSTPLLQTKTDLEGICVGVVQSFTPNVTLLARKKEILKTNLTLIGHNLFAETNQTCESKND
jgi:hypothetical protein